MDYLTSGSILVALLFASGSCGALVLAAGRPLRVTRAPIAFGLFAFATVVLGTGSVIATRALFPYYTAPIADALWLEGIGVSAVAAVVWLAAHLPQRHGRMRFEWSAPRLDALILILGVLAIVSTIGVIREIGYVPLFRGDIREERSDGTLLAGAGILLRLSLLSVPVAVLAAVRYLHFGRSSLAVAMFSAGVVCSALYGPRFFPLVAVVTALTLVDQFRRAIRVWQVIVVGAAMVPILIGAAIHRENISEADVSLSSPAITVFYFAFGEFRDFASSLSFFDRPDARLRGETLPSVVVPLLPGKLWRLVGVDKDALYARSSADVMSEYMNVPTGIRIGVVGELYMNFGIPGIVIGMVVLAGVVVMLDRRLLSSTLASPLAPFWALMVVLTTFTLIGQLNMYTSSLSGFGYPLLVAALVGARRVPSQGAPGDTAIASLRTGA